MVETIPPRLFGFLWGHIQGRISNHEKCLLVSTGSRLQDSHSHSHSYYITLDTDAHQRFTPVVTPITIAGVRCLVAPALARPSLCTGTDRNDLMCHSPVSVFSLSLHHRSL
jgi:hypothetical protein